MEGHSKSQRRQILKRGGARNRADRVSHSLTEHQCRQLICAARHTLKIGKNFNRFITTSWEIGGVPPEQSVRATGHFMSMVRDWFRDRDEILYWAWVQECGPKLGAHCHILLHVPAELAGLFSVMPLRWVKSVLAPGNHRGGVLKSRLFGGPKGPASLQEVQEAQIMGKVHYMLKAAPPELEVSLGMTGWGHTAWGRSCRVLGKRLAVSQSCQQSLT